MIPPDSDAFPQAVRAAARIDGTDATPVSRVSLEVVQLAIEGVDPTDACYQAIGRSMAANRISFARIDAGPIRRELQVEITLYDVDAKAARRTAARLFATEGQAIAGAAALVAEVTR